MLKCILQVALAILVLLTPLSAQTPGKDPLTPSRTACQRLSLEEIGRFAGGAPVEIDRKQSGPDPDSHSDGCTWQVKGGKVPLVILTIENVDFPTHAERVIGGPPPPGGRIAAAFSTRKIQAFGNGPAPVAVPGLGDEAFYRDFERVKGGALLIRRGPIVVTFSGSVPKDAYLAFGKLVIERL